MHLFFVFLVATKSWSKGNMGKLKGIGRRVLTTEMVLKLIKKMVLSLGGSGRLRSFGRIRK